MSFRRWFRRSLGRVGFDSDFLEDRDKMVGLDQAGKVLLTIEERVQEWKNSYKAEGRVEGRAEGRAEGLTKGRMKMIAHERDLLRRLAEVKFGTETAGQLAGLVAMIDDPGRLSDVGVSIINCDKGSELLVCLRTSA